MRIVIALLLLPCCAVIATDCKSGWLAGDGSCYLFGTINIGFSEAENYCRQHGGHLVEISNAHENNFLITHARQMKDRNWWIGLTDEAIESEWRWFNSDILTNFTDWGNGEPNSSTGADIEDCAFLYYKLNYAWADLTCTAIAGIPVAPLCEMSGRTNSEAVIVGK